MSKILAEIHQEMKSLYDGGFLDEATMGGFELLCKKRVKHYSPNQIKRLRKREKVSSHTFSAYLNVDYEEIEAWERGEAVPNSAAMKLLSLVDRNGLAILA
ncbi:transcriptional regulator [Serratia proteamaculans]|uniref:helix-turn-helix domain-containing protein n=1 Tax=Serratia proteamaculans TaxID=28151 RepID=UPI0010761E8D|nr:transcriptional regulator [Serratia proteamaculans]TFZ50469.1 transcriptional regulator [Serratia proteamaculans]